MAEWYCSSLENCRVVNSDLRVRVPSPLQKIKNVSKQEEILKLAVSRGYIITKDGEVFRRGKFIEGSTFSSGYRKFNIKNLNQEDHPVFLHRLQAYFKFGEKIFEKGIVVRHLNNNKEGNSWDNIRIGSQSDNMMDRTKEERVLHSIKATRNNQNKVRTFEERCKIYDDIVKNLPYSVIMEKHNISSKGTLSFMKNKSIEFKEYIGK